MQITYYALRIDGEPEARFLHQIHAVQTYLTTYRKVERKPAYEVVKVTLEIEESATHL